MATLRKGAPAKNMFGSIRRCDAVIEYRPCPNRATSTVIPDHIPGVNFTMTYWCAPHAMSRSTVESGVPELLAALRCVLFGLTDDADNNDGRIDRYALTGIVRDAITKATA